MKTQKLLPLLFAICLFLFSAHSMAHAQITFKDIAHPIEDASERGGSYMIAGADGHIFVVSINGSFYKSTDNGNSWEPFETPMSGYEVYGAAGSRDGVLVVSSDLRNPGTNGNTWFSDDNGISWRPLGNLQSGLQVIMPYIWIKPESITIQRVNIFDVETVTTYHTIYDYDGDWTTDLGGEKITPGGTEIFTKTGLGCPPGLSSYYLICDMLVLINTEGDVSYIIIHGFEDEEEESFFFHINSFEIISEEHWVLATNMGLYITEDAGDSWTILDDDTLVNSSSIQKSATGELL
ncbi:MAG: hypothetical protein LAT67_15710, partial [Balneolales bacterium]|nr:hypothetical protein [Balneolales bacterium]